MHVIDLGAKVRDTVSGWEGTATARYEYMNGCERYEVSGADKDGAPTGHVFDVQQLEVKLPAGWVDAEESAAVDVPKLHAGCGDYPCRQPEECIAVRGCVANAAAKLAAVSAGGPRDNRPVPR